MYCTNCKAKMNEGEYICRNCGTKKIIITKEEKVKFVAALIATGCTLIGVFLLFTSMPVTSSTEGKYIFGVLMTIFGMGIQIAMFIVDKK